MCYLMQPGKSKHHIDPSLNVLRLSFNPRPPFHFPVITVKPAGFSAAAGNMMLHPEMAEGKKEKEEKSDLQ